MDSLQIDDFVSDTRMQAAQMADDKEKLVAAINDWIAELGGQESFIDQHNTLEPWHGERKRVLRQRWQILFELKRQLCG